MKIRRKNEVCRISLEKNILEESNGKHFEIYKDMSMKSPGIELQTKGALLYFLSNTYH